MQAAQSENMKEQTIYNLIINYSKTYILYLRVKISESEIMQCFAKIFVFNTFTQAKPPEAWQSQGLQG